MIQNFTPEEKTLQETKMKPQEADFATDELQNETTSELIFGKFKSMEEAFESYKKAEEALQKVDVLEKQIQKYEADIRRYEEDAIAHSKGFSDKMAMALDYDVKQHELDDYACAARHMLSWPRQLEVCRLIENCRVEDSDENLMLLRQYFSPEIIALAAADIVNYKNWRQSEYEEMRQQEQKERFNRKLETFCARFKDWLKTPSRTSMFTQALEMTDGAVDLMALKELVESLEKDAVCEDLKNKNLELENQKAQESLLEPQNSIAHSKKQKWLTRAEYMKLSPKEEREKYDQIVEQIRLEKEGLLPLMLLK